jgi:hypothetical protein
MQCRFDLVRRAARATEDAEAARVRNRNDHINAMAEGENRIANAESFGDRCREFGVGHVSPCQVV